MNTCMTSRRIPSAITLTVAIIFHCGLGPDVGHAQDAVGVLHDVRIVDTSEGQDVEFSITSRPADLIPVQREPCTFAVELPNVVPGPEVTSQFFRSELVQNLTVRTAAGRAATEICVETAVPVRSRVALRATGMIMRLTRTGDEPPPEARPTDANGTPNEETADLPRVETGGSQSAGSKVRPAPAVTEDRERELTLALREERVARRELQLEMRDLRRQLAEQIEVNARLDQAATREEAQSDLLEPRIDRLASLLGVEDAGVLPVERFDAALAELRRRIDRQSEGADETRQVEQALDRLLEVIEGTTSTLVVTNDAVNVRNGPSTEEVRIAFLPAGVLLRVEQEKGAWSRVSSGTFEGWIFAELLEPAGPEPVADRSLAANGRSERLRLASEIVERLEHERQLVLQAAEERGRRGEQEQADARARLEQRQAQTEAELAMVRGENRELESRLTQKEQRLAGLERQDDDHLERRVQGLAAWLPRAAVETVRVTAATNLRSGPGTEEERLALLPPGFELVVLDRREDWVRVGYGALIGWMATAFTEPVAPLDEPGGGAQRLSADLVLDRVELLLSGAASNASVDESPAPENGGDAVLREDESNAAGPADVLRGAADAIYQQFAAARQRNARGFLAFYSEDFVPSDGSEGSWRDEVADQIESGLYAGSQVQNLSLRRVSADLVEASFLVDGADPQVPRRRRVDLAREGGRWRILVETTPERPETED